MIKSQIINDSKSKLKSFFRRKAKSFWNQKSLWILLLPAIVCIAIFKYKPMYGILLAFKNYSVALGIMKSEWVGLYYFKQLFSSVGFLRVLKNTLVISGLKLAFSFPAPIFLALLLNEIRALKFKKTVQTISYLPHFLSWVIVASLLRELLSSEGAINTIIKAFGYKPRLFLTIPEDFLLIIVLSDVWKTIGWGSIVYLAALSGIDPAIYEAATIDGCGRVKQIIYITIPSLLPVISIMFLLRVGSIMNSGFDQIFNLYNPMVYSVADTIETYTYRVGLVQMSYSYSTAVGLFKNVLGLLLMLTVNFTVNRKNDYGIV